MSTELSEEDNQKIYFNARLENVNAEDFEIDESDEDEEAIPNKNVKGKNKIREELASYFEKIYSRKQ